MVKLKCVDCEWIVDSVVRTLFDSSAATRPIIIVATRVGVKYLESILLQLQILLPPSPNTNTSSQRCLIALQLLERKCLEKYMCTVILEIMLSCTL